MKGMSAFLAMVRPGCAVWQNLSILRMICRSFWPEVLVAKVVAARVDMMPAQRHALILETLREQGAASIQSLADRLGASASTVRRDLDYLTEEGYLERTHGGAVMTRPPMARFEPEASIAAETSRVQKERIAAVAAQRVAPEQSVLFDASTTVQAAARRIVERGIALTAVTNDLRCAAALMAAPAIHTIVTGGAVRPGAATLTGEPGYSFLGGIRADVAFIGVHTVSGAVFTETSLEVAAMKRLMIEAARRVIVLADATKFCPPSFCRICAVGAVDEIITDAAPDEAQLAELRSAGVACTVAE
jgi:DeoR family transcriptional regulator of aga operon